MKYCSIVIPVFNEEENIFPIFNEIMSYFNSKSECWYQLGEIIWVNDGSEDSTLEQLNKIKSQCQLIKIISRPHYGYGAALAEGLRAASFELIVYTDGDGQYRFAECFPVLITNIPQAAYFIISGKRIGRKDSLLRRILSFVGKNLVHLINLKVVDLDCGFKIYSKALLEQIMMTSKTFFIHTEIYIQAIRKKTVIREIEILHYPREKGKANALSLKTFLQAIFESLRIFGSVPVRRQTEVSR